MRSVCSKAACRVDGKKPVMILPATSTIRKVKDHSDTEEESEDFNESDVNDESDFEDSDIDGVSLLK